MKQQKDLGSRQLHHYYFKNGTLDFLAGWMLGYSQQGGLAPGELYHCLNQIDERKPASWVDAFRKMLVYQQHEARRYEQAGDQQAAGMRYLAATVAARAALQMLDPVGAEAHTITSTMEQTFQQALVQLNIPLEPCTIPFNGKALPGYRSVGFASAPVLFVVVGGGDTYREDLWFFGGKAALEQGYAVLMVDLPGQGTTPNQQLYFGPATLEALQVTLQAVREDGFRGEFVLCGWSGGGYFTTKFVEMLGVEHDIAAWIASTPVHDIARLIEVAMPRLLRGNPDGWWQQRLVRLAGRYDPILATALKKYDYQFGPGGLAHAITMFTQLTAVDLNRLNVPLLALVGLSEDGEALQQAQTVFKAVAQRQPGSALQTFPAESGADAHCQVNNLPLAFQHIFGWLRQLGITSGVEQQAQYG